MKKQIFAFLVFVVIAVIFAGTAIATTSDVILYENFEEESINMFVDERNGKAQIVTEQEALNNVLLLNPVGGEISVYKNIRKVTGNITIGFKLLMTDGEFKVALLNDMSRPVDVLVFTDTEKAAEGINTIRYTEGVSEHIRMFFNIEKKTMHIKAGEKEMGEFIVPDSLLNGVRGVKLTAYSSENAAVQLDDIYGYIGNEERSDYEILTDEQRILYRLKNGVAVFKNRKDAIINGRLQSSHTGFAPLGDTTQMIALRSVAESFGADVSWNTSTNEAVINTGEKEMRFRIGSNVATVDTNAVLMKEECRLIGGVTYIPIETAATLFGKNLYSDERGLSILSDSQIFSPSAAEDSELLEKLIYNLSNITYVKCSEGGYVLLPDELTDTAMVPITIHSVTSNGAQEGNPAENSVDGNFETRWSSDGDGAELIIDLGEEKPVSAIYVAWYSGSERKSFFELYASQDGNNWEEILARGESTGSTENYEVYETEGKYRYIKYKGYGNSKSLWNSVAEFGALEKVVQYD